MLRTFLVVLAVLIIPVMSSAESGDIDINFNSPYGYSLYSNASGGNDYGMDIAIQQDGKILIVGYTYTGKGYDVMLARYEKSGSIDFSFGTYGIVTYNGTSGGDDKANAMVLLSDGKIIIVGSSNNGANEDVLMLRYKTTGVLDETFGNGGIVTYNGVGNGNDSAYGVTVQPEGRIVVVGETTLGSNKDALIMRLNDNGSFDEIFGASGVVTFGGSGNSADVFKTVSSQSDGKLIAAGSTVSQSNQDMLVVRYDGSGKLDASFGGSGVVTYGSSGENADYATALAIQDDGKLLVAGTVSNATTYTIALIRYATDGNFDYDFGSSGVVSYGGSSGGYDIPTDMVIENDGRILVSGITSNGSDNDAMVIRFTILGAIDTAFGQNGAYTFRGHRNGDDEFYGVVVGSDGKVVLVGTSAANNGYADILLTRLYGEPYTPIVKANYSTNNVFLKTSETLTVTIALEGESVPESESEWWIVAQTPTDWWHYDLAKKLWVYGLSNSYRGQLFNLQQTAVLSMSGLPTGTYNFYFGYDSGINAVVDIGTLFYDSITVYTY